MNWQRALLVVARDALPALVENDDQANLDTLVETLKRHLGDAGRGPVDEELTTLYRAASAHLKTGARAYAETVGSERRPILLGDVLIGRKYDVRMPRIDCRVGAAKRSVRWCSSPAAATTPPPADCAAGRGRSASPSAPDPREAARDRAARASPARRSRWRRGGRGAGAAARAAQAQSFVQQVSEDPCEQAMTFAPDDDSPAAAHAHRACRLQMFERRLADERRQAMVAEQQAREASIANWLATTQPQRVQRPLSVEGFLGTGLASYGAVVSWNILRQLEVSAPLRQARDELLEPVRVAQRRLHAHADGRQRPLDAAARGLHARSSARASR